MTLDELIAEVYVLTSRPDLEARTRSAVKAATLKAHTSDFYSKDIYEEGIKWEEAAYRQQLDPYSLFSNFRAIKYLRRVEDENDSNGTFFDIITPEEVLDSYKCTRTDIAYVAGRVIELNSGVAFSKALLGAYVLPIVTDAGYSSWVAEIHPFAIIYEAARVIFKSIGADEESAQFRLNVAEEYNLLRMTGLTDQGY